MGDFPVRKGETKMAEKIVNPDNGEYVVGCVVCRERKPVLLYPHKQEGLIVGWVFVCADDQSKVVGADVSIMQPMKPITLGAGAHA